MFPSTTPEWFEAKWSQTCSMHAYRRRSKGAIGVNTLEMKAHLGLTLGLIADVDPLAPENNTERGKSGEAVSRKTWKRCAGHILRCGELVVRQPGSAVNRRLWLRAAGRRRRRVEPYVLRRFHRLSQRTFQSLSA